MPHVPLPEDINALKQLIIEQHARIAAQEEELNAAREQLLSRDVLIEKLRIELLRLKRLRFGRSSEQLDTKIAQLELTLEELEANQSQNTPAATATSEEPPERTKPVRKALPSHLPRESIVHAPACSCEHCGGKLDRLGEDVSEMLEYVPSHFKVIRHVRPKFACSQCQTITQSAAPERPIARGLAGPGLLAHVLVSKYCDHLPLYRQSEIYARSGVELERSTLADWVGQCSALLGPLANALSRYVLSGSKLHADDTPVPVLQPGRGTTKHGRLWTYVRDDRASANVDPPAVWFAYSPDRKGVHPRTHLKDFNGVLQADGYAGFDRLFNEADPHHPIKEAACWAHVRRKFYDIHQATQSPLALEALNRIGELYAIEESIRGQPPETRQQARLARATAKLDALQADRHSLDTHQAANRSGWVSINLTICTYWRDAPELQLLTVYRYLPRQVQNSCLPGCALHWISYRSDTAWVLGIAMSEVIASSLLLRSRPCVSWTFVTVGHGAGLLGACWLSRVGAEDELVVGRGIGGVCLSVGAGGLASSMIKPGL